MIFSLIFFYGISWLEFEIYNIRLRWKVILRIFIIKKILFLFRKAILIYVPLKKCSGNLNVLYNKVFIFVQIKFIYLYIVFILCSLRIRFKQWHWYSCDSQSVQGNHLHGRVYIVPLAKNQMKNVRSLRNSVRENNRTLDFRLVFVPSLDGWSMGL